MGHVVDDLTTSVEDITEYYRQQGMCSGESCLRFMQQVSWTVLFIILRNDIDIVTLVHCVQKKNTHSHFLSYLYE